MKKTFDLTINGTTNKIATYFEAIEILDKYLAIALLERKNYKATLTFNNYEIEIVEVENGNLTKFWTKENQPCPN